MPVSKFMEGFSSRNDSWSYLAVNGADEQWGLVCTTAGFQNVPPESPYPVSQHPRDYNRISTGRIFNEYQLVYITEGGGWFESASCPRTRIASGTVMLLFPGEWHTYHPDKETGWSEMWVGFRGPVADTVLRSQHFQPSEPLYRIGISETVIGLYREILSHADKQKPGYQQMIAGIIQHIIGHVHYKYHNKAYADNPVVDKINKARLMMRDDLAGNMNVEAIAASLGMGYTWFRRVFKEYTGISPARYRTQLRMARAKELLTSSDLSVSEIAFDLGFESISQFSTFFSKHEGSSPSVFREKNAMLHPKSSQHG